jgi:hypothetical protein
MGSAPHLPPPGGDFTRQQPGAYNTGGWQSLPQGRKGSGVWLWVVGGCFGLLLLGGLGLTAAGYFGLKIFQETTGLSSEELEQRPAFAAAKLITAFNPEIELVDADEATQRITIREKSTGRTMTVSLDELKNGRITFSDSDGKVVNMEVEGEGGNGSLRIRSDDGEEVLSVQSGDAAGNEFPSWVPVPQGSFVSRNRIANGQTKIYAGKLVSPLSAEQFAAWFDGAAQAAGLEVKSRNISKAGDSVSVVLLASSADNIRMLQTTGTKTGSDGLEVSFTVIEKE